MNRRGLLKSSASALVIAAAPRPAAAAWAPFMTYAVGTGGSTEWQDLPIGAGGFISGLDVSPDGSTLIARTDTFGAYVWNPSTSRWKQIFLSTVMPSASWLNLAAGVCEMVCAPSQPTTIYCYAPDGNVYVTSNRGDTFSLTGFTTSLASPNTTLRLSGPKMAVDPINPSVVLMGTVLVGLQQTLNGGTTWANVASVPQAATDGNAPYGFGFEMAFDVSGGAGGSTSGSTNYAFVMSNGNGLYKRSTPTGSFSLVSGPTSATDMFMGPDSTLWIVDGSGNIWYWAAANWASGSPTQISSSTISGQQTVCVDPTATYAALGSRIVAMSPGGNMSVSLDRGATWPLNNKAFTPQATDIPWLGAITGYASISKVRFLPNLSNTVAFGTGVGVYTANPPNTEVSFNGTSQSLGIEQLVTNDVMTSASNPNSVVCSFWDRPLFYQSSPWKTYPSTYGPLAPPFFSQSWWTDWASSDKQTIVALVLDGSDQSATSTNGGQDWTPFPMFPMGPTFTATAATSSGAVLTFAAVPDWIYPGMLAQNYSNSCWNNNTASVLSTTSTTVTLCNMDNAGGQEPFGHILTTGTLTGGSGYVDGTYTNVPINAPSYAVGTATFEATVVVSGGAATSVTITNAGYGLVPNSLGTTPNSNLGNSGSGFSIVVATVDAVSIGDTIAFIDGGTQGGSIAASTPDNILVCPTNETSYLRYTTDGGTTWHNASVPGIVYQRAAFATNGSATIAVSDTTNFSNGLPINSKDGFTIPGNSTISSFVTNTSVTISNPCVVTGANTGNIVLSFESGWGHADFDNYVPICADRVTANKFYAFNYRTGLFYASTNSGAIWTAVNVTPANLVTAWTMGFYGKLKSVPNQAGHLFFSLAVGGGAFIRSMDGGVTWTEMSAMTGVFAYGFGAPQPSGGGYPAVYVSGTVSGLQGIYASYDAQNTTPTWTLLVQFPYGWLDNVTALDGDMNDFGRVFGGYGGSGCFGFF